MCFSVVHIEKRIIIERNLISLNREINCIVKMCLCEFYSLVCNSRTMDCEFL